MRTTTFLFLSLFLVACGTTDTPTDNTNNQNTNTSDPVCGNGILEPGEACDDGADNSDVAPNACRTDCREPSCGDGVIDSGEACDGSELASNSCVGLGYTKGTLACDPITCEYDVRDCSTCGDGVAEGTDTSTVGYETCDGSDLRGKDCISIGQAMGTLACNSSCEWDISGCVGGGPVCGNGIVEEGEECDDGNHTLTDNCPDGPAGTCLSAYCGDGYVQAGIEGCDDGNGTNEDICPDGPGGTCQTASCGDGFVFTGAENCDTALDPYCHTDCVARCGDGTVDTQFGERCDDGNNVDDEDCYSDCSGYCGDAIVHDGTWDENVQAVLPDHGEECDRGPVGGIACSASCTLTDCGNGSCFEPVETPDNCPQDCP